MNFNQITLAGRLTRDIQLSYTPSQTAVADFGMAVNKKWKTQGGEPKEATLFIDCVAFGKSAENLNKYVGKGDSLLISGELQFESWTAQDGSKRSKHKIMVQSFQFVPTGAGERTETPESKPEAKQRQAPVNNNPDDDVPW